MLLVLHVDDFILSHYDMEQLKWVTSKLGASYGLKDLGKLEFALGTHFVRDEAGIALSQREYISSVLEKFGFEESHSVPTPAIVSTGHSLKLSGLEEWDMNEIVGCLIWLSVISRPDISFAVAKLAQAVADPV